MRFAEDLVVDTPIDCGTASFTTEEIVEFARRYDPQPFHLSEEGGAASLLFGRLTASGLQTAARARHAVLSAVMRDTCFLGSPGARRFQMHKPVYPDMTLRFTHTVTDIRPLEHFEGVALVRSATRAHAPTGTLVMTVDGLDWIGTRRLSPESDSALLRSLRSSDGASEGLQPLPQAIRVERPASALNERDKLYLKECLKDAIFSTKEFTVTDEDFEDFRSRYSVSVASGRVLMNEWYGMALGIRIFADDFWLRVSNVGGSGMDDARWPTPIEPGDVLRGEMRIVQSRQLRSKPELGSVVSNCICVNQRDDVIASFIVTTFIRVREP